MTVPSFQWLPCRRASYFSMRTWSGSSGVGKSLTFWAEEKFAQRGRSEKERYKARVNRDMEFFLERIDRKQPARILERNREKSNTKQMGDSSQGA
jgi:hypothetical protein